VINLAHSDGADFYPIDYRIYAPEADGKTKNDHFREMLLNVVSDKHIQARTLTGSEKCECRKARSQRNHLACCYLAWLSLKVKAQQWGKTLYAAPT